MITHFPHSIHMHIQCKQILTSIVHCSDRAMRVRSVSLLFYCLLFSPYLLFLFSLPSSSSPLPLLVFSPHPPRLLPSLSSSSPLLLLVFSPPPTLPSHFSYHFSPSFSSLSLSSSSSFPLLPSSFSSYSSISSSFPLLCFSSPLFFQTSPFRHLFSSTCLIPSLPFPPISFLPSPSLPPLLI